MLTSQTRKSGQGLQRQELAQKLRRGAAYCFVLRALLSLILTPSKAPSPKGSAAQSEVGPPASNSQSTPVYKPICRDHFLSWVSSSKMSLASVLVI